MTARPPGVRLHYTVLRVAIAMAALGPGAAAACDVCYGNSDSPWIDASRASVWLLLGITVALQIAFAAFFLQLRNRMKANVWNGEAQELGFEPVEGKGEA